VGSEETVEDLAGFSADQFRFSRRWLIVQMGRVQRRMTSVSISEVEGGFGEVGFGVTEDDAEAMVEGAVEGGGVAEEEGAAGIEVAHFFDDVDALGGGELLEGEPGAFEAEVHRE
jgi:hypothetical protein